MKTSELLSKIQKVNTEALYSALEHLRICGVSEKSLDNMPANGRAELAKLLSVPKAKK